ncbi:MAG TPA: sulfatase [Candidatus Paceibacterota bacterium]|nr:sulfatase [Verrucomicrobiota bacterium]HSA10984.1 sulfatase [Candidatus Paceibacterota bacterium]
MRLPALPPILLVLTCFAGVTPSQAAVPPSTARPPNVLFVLADQWRAEAFGYAGNPDVKTPHLDQLQREGVHLVNAVSGLPVCCPTRASLLTGQRPLTHGVFLNDVPLDPEAVTIGKVLRAAGYDTGYIGKWHVDGHGRSNFIPRERRQGFEYWKVLECTHDYNHSAYYADGPEKLYWDGYDAIAQTRDAQQYLRDHAQSQKPFFLYLAWGPPHDPYFTAPEKYRAMYDPAKLTLRPNVPEAGSANARKVLAGYYAHCTALDDCFGELRRTLQETGLAENTLLVFTSDHGDMLGSQGATHKQRPWDEAIRVPLLVRWPKGLGTKARHLDAPINSEDLMPTLLGLCGLPVPKTVEGLDYSGYVRGKRNPGDGATVFACVSPFGQWTRRQGGKEYRGVRTTRYTYVRDLNGPWLLYDNQTDPCQTNNLVNMPKQARLQARLEGLLSRKLKERHDEFLSGEAYIKQWGYKVDANGTVPYER